MTIYRDDVCRQEILGGEGTAEAARGGEGDLVQILSHRLEITLFFKCPAAKFGVVREAFTRKPAVGELKLNSFFRCSRLNVTKLLSLSIITQSAEK